jgi:hypothetical protein
MPLEQLRLDHDRRLVSIILSMMLVPTLWFVGRDLVDGVTYARWLDSRFMTVVSVIALPVVGLILIRNVQTAIQYSHVVFGLSFALGGLMFSLSLHRPIDSVILMRTPLLYLITVYGALPNTFKRQIAAPIVYSAAMAALRIWWFPAPDSEMASDLLVLVCANGLGIVMVLRRRRLEREVGASWRREHAARAEAEQALKHLQTLQGIIKICSYCRKVHSETGVWQQIETYVREKTGVEFSHGICPTCLAEHYPEGEPIEV